MDTKPVPPLLSLLERRGPAFRAKRSPFHRKYHKTQLDFLLLPEAAFPDDELQISLENVPLYWWNGVGSHKGRNPNRNLMVTVQSSNDIQLALLFPSPDRILASTVSTMQQHMSQPLTAS